MAKTVDSITRALKPKAQSKNGALTLRLGVKKLTLPFEVRTLTGTEYVFVHIPPSAAIMKIGKDGLSVVETVEDATKAQSDFRPSRKKGSRRKVARTTEIPDAVKAALKEIPSGYKLVFGPTGEPRMVKMRKRSK